MRSDSRISSARFSSAVDTHRDRNPSAPRLINIPTPDSTFKLAQRYLSFLLHVRCDVWSKIQDCTHRWGSSISLKYLRLEFWTDCKVQVYNLMCFVEEWIIFRTNFCLGVSVVKCGCHFWKLCTDCVQNGIKVVCSSLRNDNYVFIKGL